MFVCNALTCLCDSATVRAQLRIMVEDWRASPRRDPAQQQTGADENDVPEWTEYEHTMEKLLTQVDESDAREETKKENKQKLMRGDEARGSFVHGNGPRGGEKRKTDRTGSDGGENEWDDDGFLRNKKHGPKRRKKIKSGDSSASLTPASGLMESLSSYLQGASTTKDARAETARKEVENNAQVKMKEFELQEKREEREHELKLKQQEADTKQRDVQNRKD